MSNVVRLTLNDISDLSGMEGRAREKALEIMREGAHRICIAAKQICPVATGSLRDSIRVENTSKGLAVRAGGFITRPDGRPVDYAVFVNARVPFMDLAFWSVTPEIEARLKSEVVGVLKP